MNLYRELRTISAVTFHEIKFGGNIFLMDIDFDDKKKYETHEIVEINETWLKLYDEYYQKTDDPRLRRELKNRKKTLKLLININMLEVIISALELMKEHEEYIPESVKLSTLNSFKASLKRIGRMIVFDPGAKIETNLKHVKSYTGGLKTRYQLLFKSDMKVDENDLLLYYEIKSNIEAILKKDNIPDHINMLQWIAYEKQAKIRLKHGRKHNKGIRRS